MNKKLIFHIFICILLFVAITVPHMVFSDRENIPYAEAKDSVKDDEAVTEDDGVIIIGEEIKLSYVPESVSPGDNTFIEIIGSAETLYDINVYYSSGISTAKAFVDKYSGEDGKVSWEFKVSAKTTAQKLRVVIRSEKSYISFCIPITEL